MLYSPPEMYRYSGCEGFEFGGNYKHGCVPRDDAMDDWEDYVNYIAHRYTGNQFGKIYHFIVGNEVNHGGWFDYSPIIDSHNPDALPAFDRWIDKYADMFRRSYRAIRRFNPDARVYVSVDRVWQTDMRFGKGNLGSPFFSHSHHMGAESLIDGIWSRLGTEIDWSLVVHAYGELARPDPDPPWPTMYTFRTLPNVVAHQQQKLRELGVLDPFAPQAMLYASEQTWSRGIGAHTPGEVAENLCIAHDIAQRTPNILGYTHPLFHSARTTKEFPDGNCSNKPCDGMLPFSIAIDLGNADGYPTWEALRSTSTSLWGLDNQHYCCTEHALGCGKWPPIYGYVDGVESIPSGSDVDADQYLTGWACADYYPAQLNVRVYRQDPFEGDIFLGEYPANFYPDRDYTSNCHTSIAHGFKVSSPNRHVLFLPK